MTKHPERSYLPAAGHDFFLPLYDPITKLLGGDKAKKKLLGHANLAPGQSVLDIGCGTGTLLVTIKQLHPQVEVFGIDPDPKALARAKRKAEKASVSLQIHQGYSDALPFDPAMFDRIFSSFMFHHLHGDEKLRTLREVRRVLRSGGSLHLVDFVVKDNSEDRILGLMNEAGLHEPQALERGRMLFLRSVYYRASVI